MSRNHAIAVMEKAKSLGAVWCDFDHLGKFGEQECYLVGYGDTWPEFVSNSVVFEEDSNGNDKQFELCFARKECVELARKLFENKLANAEDRHG